MNMPRNLIEIDWFRTAATANPVSYLIEARPEPDHRPAGTSQALALGFGVAAALAVVALALAACARSTAGWTRDVSGAACCRSRGRSPGGR